MFIFLKSALSEHQRFLIACSFSVFSFYSNFFYHCFGFFQSFNVNFRGAVLHTRQFYSLQNNPECPTQKGYLSQLIRESIENGQYCGTIMSMHNNFYWHRMLLEDNTTGQACAECALAELRSYIYRMVLPRQECLVNEFGRSPWEPLRKAAVTV